MKGEQVNMKYVRCRNLRQKRGGAGMLGQAAKGIPDSDVMH